MRPEDKLRGRIVEAILGVAQQMLHAESCEIGFFQIYSNESKDQNDCLCSKRMHWVEW